MEKRSLFSFIFVKKQQPEDEKQTLQKLELLNGFVPEFRVVSNYTYDSKVARECIDRIATHCAKLVPKHIKNSISNNIKGDINRLISTQPNPIMNTYDFLYKVISNLYSNKNAFIYIHRDKLGIVQGFYPLNAVSEQLYEDENGKIYLQFQFMKLPCKIQYTLLFTAPPAIKPQAIRAKHVCRICDAFAFVCFHASMAHP